MKIEIKVLKGTKWYPIPTENLIGSSICNYMIRSNEILCAALFDDDDKKIAIVSNVREYADKYKDKLFTITAQDLQYLLGTEPLSPVVAQLFPDSQLIGVKTIKENAA